MKVSDYDRQEFIQALRELADGNGGELLDHVKCLRVDELGDFTIFGVGAVLAMDEAGCCDAEDASGYLAALADIVEWPTCRNVHGGREMVEKECLKKENAELKADLADWKGNAEGFQPDAYMKLPLDANGEPIRVGDVLYSGGNECRVVSITVKADEACVAVYADDGTFYPWANPKYLSRKNTEPLEPESADSWKKLEEDARKTACDYAPAPRNEDGLTTCDGCPFLKSESCSNEMTIDLVERAKKLAGIEDGGSK